MRDQRMRCSDHAAGVAMARHSAVLALAISSELPKLQEIGRFREQHVAEIAASGVNSTSPISSEIWVRKAGR